LQAGRQPEIDTLNGRLRFIAASERVKSDIIRRKIQKLPKAGDGTRPCHGIVFLARRVRSRAFARSARRAPAVAAVFTHHEREGSGNRLAKRP